MSGPDDSDTLASFYHRGVSCLLYDPPEPGKEHEWLLRMAQATSAWIECKNYGMAYLTTGLMRSVLEALEKAEP